SVYSFYCNDIILLHCYLQGPRDVIEKLLIRASKVKLTPSEYREEGHSCFQPIEDIKCPFCRNKLNGSINHKCDSRRRRALQDYATNPEKFLQDYATGPEKFLQDYATGPEKYQEIRSGKGPGKICDTNGILEFTVWYPDLVSFTLLLQEYFG
ncbi:MAG: hypothetical protein KGL95_06815, partial [Patescibacteria group bacterium]|nr:hypothetical protein [Patescibacteria group bacterium]